MSARLKEYILEKRRNGQKLLSIFITAGFPAPSYTTDIVLSLEKAGVDFIELGIPFSDPIADGPVIQHASDTALRNGIGMKEIFDMLVLIRKKSRIPIILMGYLNPIYQFGVERALNESKKNDVDGWIIPDWPLEESQQYTEHLNKVGIDLIHLVAPNTPDQRVREIDAVSHCFLYCVAYTGTTGSDNLPSPENLSFLKKIKNTTTNPLMVGFGIKNNQDYRMYTSIADGVIIGSAFIRMIQNSSRSEIDGRIKKFIREIREDDLL